MMNICSCLNITTYLGSKENIIKVVVQISQFIWETRKIFKRSTHLFQINFYDASGYM